jgi:hypothetical protein
LVVQGAASEIIAMQNARNNPASSRPHEITGDWCNFVSVNQVELSEIDASQIGGLCFCLLPPPNRDFARGQSCLHPPHSSSASVLACMLLFYRRFVFDPCLRDSDPRILVRAFPARVSRGRLRGCKTVHHD